MKTAKPIVAPSIIQTRSYRHTFRFAHLRFPIAHLRVLSASAVHIRRFSVAPDLPFVRRCSLFLAVSLFNPIL
jgi:hypothetical protein